MRKTIPSFMILLLALTLVSLVLGLRVASEPSRLRPSQPRNHNKKPGQAT